MEATRVDVQSEQSAIVPTLRFEIDIRNDQGHFDVLTGDGKFQTENNNEIAPLDYASGVDRLNQNQQNTFVFHCYLSREILSQIEEIRRGQDLQYTLELYLLGQEQNQNNPERRNIEINSERTRLPQSDWARILRDLDYGDIRILEFRFPDSPSKSIFEEAYNHLDDANRQFLDGEYRSSMASSRNVVRSVHNSENINLEDLLDEERADRFSQILGKFSHYMSGASHPSDEIPYEEISRADAEFALISAQAVLRYSSEMYSE